MRPQARPFAELRMAMSKYGVNQRDLAKIVNREETYISSRMNCKISWSLKDIQLICDYMEIPEGEIYKYFPLEDVRGRDMK